LLADGANWVRVSGIERKLERCHTALWCIKGLEARGQWPEIRRLEGVIETPVLRADGTILCEPGYDSYTGLLFLPNANYPAAPEPLTRDHAHDAVAELLEVVADFPFASPAYRAAWLASVLTPFATFAFHGPKPLFLIDANIRGSGKSLLADVTGEVAFGRAMPRTAYTSDSDELRKRITAIALSGDLACLFDNIDGTLGGASLDAALTATSWSDRVLGASEMASGIPLHVCWYATGNNLVLRPDTARRTLHIRLEVLSENPENRTGFAHSPLLAWVQQERPRLAMAALTILAAYCKAGRPSMDLEPWGSFEAWSDLVRNAVVWAGVDDPAATRAKLAEQSDRETCALRQLINGWEEADPSGAGMTVSEVLTLLADRPQEFDALRGALLELAPSRDGKQPGARSIGMKLHHLQRRVVGGRYMERRDGKMGVFWYVMNTDGGTRGTRGTKTGYPARALS